jgi:hypothetical protein
MAGETCVRCHPASEAVLHLIERAFSVGQGTMPQGADGLPFIAGVAPYQAANGHELGTQGSKTVLTMGIPCRSAV